jgi:hypothetical protein
MVSPHHGGYFPLVSGPVWSARSWMVFLLTTLEQECEAGKWPGVSL